MAIHITRGNMLSGNGAPQVSAEYYGQTYIDTGANPRGIWAATAQNSEGWKELSQVGHMHTISDFTDLIPEITKIVQAQGIEAALTSLRGGNNIWEGDWNNFTGVLRVGGKDVLSGNSSIGDLSDVKLNGDTLKANALLGWNGSAFVPYEVSGASPAEGGLDFSQYIKKDTLVSDLTSASTELALAASAGKALVELMKAGYAPIDHTHTGLAAKNHTHANYLDKTVAQTMTAGLTFDTPANVVPLSIRNPFGRMDFQFPKSDSKSIILGISGNGGNTLTNVILGGVDGTIGDKLTLNFTEVIIPSGQIRISENKRNLGLPAMKVSEPDLTYVGNLNRKSAIDANGGAINGLSQLIFKTHSNSRDAAILFPRNYAGNGQPTESGYYHYLRLSDGEMKTDTALNSEARYLTLNGVRYFFGIADPGKLAREGDVWICQA